MVIIIKVKARTNSMVRLYHQRQRLANDHVQLFIFTAIQYPGMTDEGFAMQCESLKAEFAHIVAHVDAELAA